MMQLEMSAGAQAEKPVVRKLLCVHEGSALIKLKLHVCVCELPDPVKGSKNVVGWPALT